MTDGRSASNPPPSPVATTPDGGVWAFWPASAREWFDPRVRAQLGIGDAPHASLFELVDAVDALRLRQALTIAARTGAGFSILLSTSDRAGDARGAPLSLQVVCVDTGGEDAKHFVGTLTRTGAPEAPALEADRRDAVWMARLNQEIRSPLNVLLGHAQMLERDAALSTLAPQFERLRRIVDAGWQLLSIVDGAVEHLRLDSGELLQPLSPTDLEAIVRECIVECQEAANRRRLSLHFVRESAAASPALVWADGARLRQVLIGLVDNAIKYNVARGSIEVALEAGGDTGTCVRITDSGIGMSADQVSAVFGRDTPGAARHAVRPSRFGLAMASELAAQMGGSLAIESIPGLGTTVRLKLREVQGPAPESAGSARMLSDAELTREDVRGAVLYVEDDPLNTSIVEAFFEFRPNVQLFTAPDATTGLALALTSRLDLLLFDLRLPDFDGFELLERVRAARPPITTPCIALTADAMPGDEDDILQRGFQAYLPKPLIIEEFLAVVDRFLTRGEPEVRRG